MAQIRFPRPLRRSPAQATPRPYKACKGCQAVRKVLTKLVRR